MGFFGNIGTRIAAGARRMNVNVRGYLGKLGGIEQKERQTLKREAVTALEEYNLANEKVQLLGELIRLAQRERLVIANMQKIVQAEQHDMTSELDSLRVMRAAEASGKYSAKELAMLGKRALAGANNATHRAVIAAADMSKTARPNFLRQMKLLGILTRVTKKQMNDLGLEIKSISRDEIRDKQIRALLKRMEKDVLTQPLLAPGMRR
jgi:hypothetical protein